MWWLISLTIIDFGFAIFFLALNISIKALSEDLEIVRRNVHWDHYTKSETQHLINGIYDNIEEKYVKKKKKKES